MKERRVYRVRALKGAQIVFNSGNSTLDCVIRNTSEHGARLKSVQAEFPTPSI